MRRKSNARGFLIGEKHEAMIELDEGFKLRVKRGEIKPLGKNPTPAQKPKITLETRQSRGGVTLDLHGLRSDEALENLDRFIYDALLSGFDEVLVYHGIGTGRLAHAVKEFLKSHPKVRTFEDAPATKGGFGAKIIKL